MFNSCFLNYTNEWRPLFCVDRLVLGTLPVVTTPPMCRGRSPTCWASSVWYGPATGALSKSATRRTASPSIGTVQHGLARPEEEQTPLLCFSILFGRQTGSRSVEWGHLSASGQECVEGALRVLVFVSGMYVDRSSFGFPEIPQMTQSRPLKTAIFFPWWKVNVGMIV